MWVCVLNGCRNNREALDGNVFDDGLDGVLNSNQMQYAWRMLTDAIEPRADVPCTPCSVYRSLRKQGRTLAAQKLLAAGKARPLPVKAELE